MADALHDVGLESGLLFDVLCGFDALMTSFVGIGRSW
jgi:hypothetical protein